MFLGKKFVLRKNHWKVYLLILLGLLYNLQLAFQTDPNPEVEKIEKPRKYLNLPYSSSYFGINADSVQNKERLTQRIEKL